MIKNVEQTEMTINLPKNIRQLGEVTSGNRIYIEDYAYTYLHQYADQGEEQIAFLIGTQKAINDENVLLINGAIEGKGAKREGSSITLNEEAWQYAVEMRNKYFEDKDIVGWAVSQPNYGVILTSALLEQHESVFQGEGQALLILEPVEKDEVFFVYENGDMIQQSGFFVYYEKNLGMHDYMLDQKNGDEVRVDHLLEDRAVKSYRAKELVKREEVYHKKFVNMLFVLSGALVIMCIMIGVGLINNYEEMNNLKKSFTLVMEDYSAIKTGSVETNSQDVLPELTTAAIVEANASSVDTTTKIASTEPASEAIDITTDVATDVVEQVTEAGNNKAIVLPETYVVQPGDSLLKISYRFYKTKEMVASIQKLNGIDNQDHILIGQVLALPSQLQ